MWVVAWVGTPSTFRFSDDHYRAWEEVGPYLMHDVRMYGEWNVDKTDIASISQARTVDALRAEQGTHRIYSVDEAVEIVKGGGLLSLMPVCGGLPPELAWKYLKFVTDDVMPAAK